MHSFIASGLSNCFGGNMKPRASGCRGARHAQFEDLFVGHFGYLSEGEVFHIYISVSPAWIWSMENPLLLVGGGELPKGLVESAHVVAEFFCKFASEALRAAVRDLAPDVVLLEVSRPGTSHLLSTL